MSEIKVIMNNGGVIESVYVSPDIEDIDVEIIDFCTDDPYEEEEAEEAWKKVEEAEKNGTLIAIY